MMYPLNTGLILQWLFPDADPLTAWVVTNTGGVINITLWNLPDPKPTEAEILAQEKPWAASTKQEEIYREQEIRTRTVMGSTEIPRDIFDFIEEFYTKILIPAARNNITEADTPKTWGLRELRNNRNTLLNGLQAWVDDPAKTAADILSFDVQGWAGWDIPRP